MKCTFAAFILPIFLSASGASASFIYRFANETSTSSAPGGIPTPPTVGHMTCAGGLDTPCQSLCTCSGGSVNCHADPTSRCVQMCAC
ncbi:hypothetical protein F4821DRAFT_279698 [Hypoxylon rubiginosum]|uniref:Uncharacterized protein n=1 Tax=Hypoxylon rubiginosum TaxID=110542 RepID=A0ACC0CWZ0_9PEZI|nr:hypothetical protein F4821DRAFT_279698 [Hypoxylon rubiginosum]